MRIGSEWGGGYTHLMTPETRWGATLCGAVIVTTHEGDRFEATCPKCIDDPAYDGADCPRTCGHQWHTLAEEQAAGMITEREIARRRDEWGTLVEYERGPS